MLRTSLVWLNGALGGCYGAGNRNCRLTVRTLNMPANLIVTCVTDLATLTLHFDRHVAPLRQMNGILFLRQRWTRFLLGIAFPIGCDATNRKPADSVEI
jgi:hypothetical protein